MNIIKRVTLLAISLLLALGLASCGASGPDMPMEVTVNGKTVVIGKTTTGEMANWGWEVAFMNSQSDIRKDAKYVACHYHIKVDGGGAGQEFWVSVYVPFQKNISGSTVDLSKEKAESKTAGVVYRVDVRKSAGEKLSISYNGMDLQNITWDIAEEWGATVDEESYYKSAELAVSQGTLKFQQSAGEGDEVNELNVIMSTSAFSKLQSGIKNSAEGFIHNLPRDLFAPDILQVLNAAVSAGTAGRGLSTGQSRLQGARDWPCVRAPTGRPCP